MVDTIHCSSESDLTEPFFYKLLLGAIDKVADHKEIHRDRSEGKGRLADETSGGSTYRTQSLHGAQTSTHTQQERRTRFFPTSPYAEQQHFHQEHQQDLDDDRDPWMPERVQRHFTLPQNTNAAELPIRPAMRSSTFGQKPPAK